MALYPCQNSNSGLQHCCFELLLVFTFQCPTCTIQHCHTQFNVHISNATRLEQSNRTRKQTRESCLLSHIIAHQCLTLSIYLCRTGIYTRFQCYVHRQHFRSSFDMPSFGMLFKRLFNCKTGNFSCY